MMFVEPAMWMTSIRNLFSLLCQRARLPVGPIPATCSLLPVGCGQHNGLFLRGLRPGLLGGIMEGDPAIGLGGENTLKRRSAIAPQNPKTNNMLNKTWISSRAAKQEDKEILEREEPCDRQMCNVRVRCTIRECADSGRTAAYTPFLDRSLGVGFCLWLSAGGRHQVPALVPGVRVSCSPRVCSESAKRAAQTMTPTAAAPQTSLLKLHRAPSLLRPGRR